MVRRMTREGLPAELYLRPGHDADRLEFRSGAFLPCDGEAEELMAHVDIRDVKWSTHEEFNGGGG